MVLEHVLPEKLKQQHFFGSAAAAYVYALISTLLASAIFGASSGIVSVAFLTFFLLPTVRKLFKNQEEYEEQETHYAFKRLFYDNNRVIKAYAGIFFGVFFGYLTITFLLPQFGIQVFTLLREQMLLDPALAGRATAMNTFTSILANNWLVLLAAFVLALIWSDGALFFVLWNASAWGAIFGARALAAAAAGAGAPWMVLATELVFVAPHVILEGGAYILAAISGSVIADEVVKKAETTREFVLWGTLLIILGFALSKMIGPQVSSITLTAILVVYSLIVLVALQKVFDDEHHRELYIYNIALLVMALVVFVVGVGIETILLTTNNPYTNILAFL